LRNVAVIGRRRAVFTDGMAVGAVRCEKLTLSCGLVTNLGDFAALIPGDHGLCVVSTLRPDASIQSTVVNGGVLDHPVTDQPCVGFVARGNSRKLSHLRLRPQATVVVRAGWQWVAAEGQVDLIGPDDPRDSIDSEALRLLLREIFSAAGGSHDDWDTYDRVMADERRTAVLLTPRRIYSNS
jgi:PPOX class probable F420-dependent enzyme